MAPGPPQAPAGASCQASCSAGRTLALLLLLLCSAPLAGSEQVRIVLGGIGAMYGELADSLEDHLRRTPEGRRLSLQRVQPDAPGSAGGADLTVAVGMKACASAGARPLLCVLVPRAGFERIAGSRPDPGLSAIYLDQPALRQLALARALLPDARRAGILAGPDLLGQAVSIHAGARAADLQVTLEAVSDASEAARGIQRLVTDNDLIVAVHDPDVLTPSTAKWLLHLAYQERIPVVGFSRAYVTAGAAAAVYSTPEQIGRQAAEAVLAWVRGGRLPEPAYPRYFDVAVNRPVGEALGLRVPAEEELARAIARRSGGSVP